MEGVWICSECGSANEYPNATECDVCGKAIDENEIKDAEKRLKDIIKSNEEYERNQQKEELLRKRQEAEHAKKIRQEQKQAERQARIQKNKARLNKLHIKEEKLLDSYYKALKVLRVCLIVLVVASIVIVCVSVVRQDSFDVILTEIDHIAESTREELTWRHFYTKRSGEKIFEPFRNITKQYEYLKREFRNSDGIRYLFNALGW